MDPARRDHLGRLVQPGPGERPDRPAAGEPVDAFRLDQLFNYGGTVEYQNGELDLPGEPAAAPRPATPPAPAPRPAAGPVPGHRPGHRQALRGRLRLDQPHLRHPLPRRRLRHAGLHRGRAQREHHRHHRGTGGDARHRGPGPGRVEDRRPAPSTWLKPARHLQPPGVRAAATTPASPTSTRAPRPRSTRPTSTRPPRARPAGPWRGHLRVRGDRPVQRGRLDQHRPVPGLRDRRPPGRPRPGGGHRADRSVSLVWQSICHAANYIVYRAPGSATTAAGPRSAPMPRPTRPPCPTTAPATPSPAQTATVCQGPTSSPHLVSPASRSSPSPTPGGHLGAGRA